MELKTKEPQNAPAAPEEPPVYSLFSTKDTWLRRSLLSWKRNARKTSSFFRKKRYFKGVSCIENEVDCYQLINQYMADSFSRIYLQFVFAVRGRQSLIAKENKEELHKYMTKLVQNRGAKMLAVHCMPDHSHLFVGFKPSILISDFIKEIKVESNEFINDKKWTKDKFSWQEGYGVFSYSHSHIDNVVKYVLNQEKHHRRKTFRAEYHELLEKFELPFKERVLFDFLD